MILAMPVNHHLRATVITPKLTYRAHLLEIDESTRVAQVIDRNTTEPVLTMTDAEWSNPMDDRNQYRIAGVVDGVAVVWRAVSVCASCASQAVTQTPGYDIPT